MKPYTAISAASRSRRWIVAAILVWVAAAGGIVAWWWPRPQPRASVVASDDADLDEPTGVSNPGYLGPEACGECHATRLAELQKTRHFRACRPPEAGPMPPGFSSDNGTYASRHPGLRFQMTQSGNDFFQTLIRTAPAGEERFSSRIDLVYGSGGKADEVFFTWKDDRLYELPMAWLHPQKRWAEQPYNPHTPGDFTRITTTRCVECHNTWFEHVAGTENQYRRENFILNVTCERCHGPGREHVTFHREHPDAESGHAVVHPGRLTRERQLDVCAQCHSNALMRRGPAFSYRPGEPLDAHFRTLVAQDLEKDHVADQVKYLRQSKCFQKSDTITCTTCHNPHRATSANAGEPSCLKCHQAGHCSAQQRLPVAVRNNCVACHMPSYTRIAVKFHTDLDQYVFPVRPRNHRIAVYPTALQEVLLAWYGTQQDAPSRSSAAKLTKSLVEHWLTESEKLRREYRFLASIAALREAVRLDPTPAASANLKALVAIQAKLDADLFAAQQQFNDRRYQEAIETLRIVLKVKPTESRAHAKLGTLYEIVGQHELAVQHLQAVAQFDADEPYGYNMLGWLAYLKGKGEEAVAAFCHADEISPYNSEINYRWGLALLLLEQFPEAVARFRKVLLIDPNHARGCQGLSHALRRQRRPEEALRFARRAARLTRFQNVEILQSLIDAYTDAGRLTEAAETAAQALDVARTGSPHRVPQIRRRLEELRARSKQTAE